jgi:hypothetical protein
VPPRRAYPSGCVGGAMGLEPHPAGVRANPPGQGADEEPRPRARTAGSVGSRQACDTVAVPSLRYDARVEPQAPRMEAKDDGGGGRRELALQLALRQGALARCATSCAGARTRPCRSRLRTREGAGVDEPAQSGADRVRAVLCEVGAAPDAPHLAAPEHPRVAHEPGAGTTESVRGIARLPRLDQCRFSGHEESDRLHERKYGTRVRCPADIRPWSRGSWPSRASKVLASVRL